MYRKMILPLVVAVSLGAAGFAAAQEKAGAKSADECQKCPLPTKAATAKPAKAAPGTVLLSVEGLRCEGCAMKLRNSLREVPGVKDVTVDVKNQRAVLILVKGKKAPADAALRETVSKAGPYKVVAVTRG
jgi:copper chaperone CopZ